jgi:tetratricopeptide (TPR) repeat protein
MYLQQGQPERMFPIFDEMLQISREVGNYRLEAWSLGWESVYALRYSSVGHALRCREAALAVAQEFHMAYDLAWGTWELGEIHRVAGDPAAARHWFEQSALLFEQQDLTLGLGFYHRGLGDLALAGGDATAGAAAAQDHFRRYLEKAQETGFSWSEAYALYGLGRAAIGLGRLDEAIAHFRSAIQLAETTGRNDVFSLPLAGLAHLALAAGNPQLALVLSTLVECSPFTWNETREWIDALAAEARTMLDDQAAQAAETRGRNANLDTFIPQFLSIPESEARAWIRL